MDNDYEQDAFTNEMLSWYDKLLQKIENRLEPLMTGLSPGEREHCEMASLQTPANARKALQVAQEFEYAFGIEVDVEEFALDMNQYEKAQWMLDRIQPFVQRLEDTAKASRFRLLLHTQDVLINAKFSEDPGLARAGSVLERELMPKRHRKPQGPQSEG